MATVQVEWIDSVSVAATGNKIYRDDVEIADIANGVQTYTDNSSPDGTQSKYEVQAHDGAGDETTQEVEGVNMDYITTSGAPVNIYPLDNAASPTPDEVNSPGSWTSSGANPLSTADQAINGTYSMRARLTGANATWYASCPVEVEAGKTYNYSIWARREGTSNNARFRNWQGFDLSPDIGVINQTWTEYTGTVTATSTGTAYIRVYPNVDAGAAQGDGVYFDDIVIS